MFVLLTSLAFFVLGTQGVYAADAAAPASPTGISAEDGQKLIGYMNMFLQMAAAILGLVTSFVSIFLYPGWVNGTMFGLQDYLKIIWILVSNVIYFIFAGILIVIAFMNIIGKWEGTWELKQAMPKFIIGVLIVPFSWFFVQFLLSLSAILTVGVLTLPYESFQNEQLFGAAMEESEITNQKFCKDIIISFSGDFGGQATTDLTDNDGEGFPENIKCKDEEGSKVSIKEIISGEGGGEGLDNNVFGIISVYTYGILRVQELDTIAALDLTTIKGIMDLILKVIFDLLFVVVYLILMVALFLALMVRGVRLWVYMMLSPAFGLLYFLGKGSEWFWSGENGTKFSIAEFISLAMVPVYASAALAFGLVFILVATEGIKEASSQEDLDTLKAGWFSISIVWAHADGEEEKSVIGKLIVELFGVAILWIAVMAALGSSETTKTVTAPIQQFWSSVWKLVTAAPTYMPLPASLGWSAAGLAAMWSTIQSKISWTMQERWSTRGAALFGWDPQQAAAMTRATNTLAASTRVTDDVLRDVRSALEWLWDTQKIASDPQAVELLNETLKKAGITDITVTNTARSVATAIWALDEHARRNGEKELLAWDLTRNSTTRDVDTALRWNPLPAVEPETPASGNTPVAGATINITSNPTITPLISWWKIAGADAGAIDTNATTIATQIQSMMGTNRLSIADMRVKLTAMSITDVASQDKIITALGNSVV